MKILFLSPFDPINADTGPANHLRGLSKALCKLGCEVHISVLEPKNCNCSLNGVQIHYLHHVPRSLYVMRFLRGPFTSLSSYREVSNLCREYKIDVVHNQCSASWLYGLIRGGNMPFVATLHATAFGELISRIGIPLTYVGGDFVLDTVSELWELCWGLIKFGKRAIADKFIAVSKALAEEAIRFFNFPRDKVITIHNGIDLSNSATRVREEESEEDIILSVGRLVWRKGYKYLIEAMPKILLEYPAAKLIIVGYGDQRIPLQRYVKKLGINHAVLFLEKVSKETLYSLYHRAKVYVQPSLYEPLGITILEAMSMRKPVIATKVGGIPEIITNGFDGILVEPKNSLQLARVITHVLMDSSLRKKLGDNARKKVEKDFTWELVAKKHLELYNNLLVNK